VKIHEKLAVLDQKLPNFTPKIGVFEGCFPVEMKVGCSQHSGNTPFHFVSDGTLVESIGKKKLLINY